MYGAGGQVMLRQSLEGLMKLANTYLHSRAKVGRLQGGMKSIFGRQSQKSLLPSGHSTLAHRGCRSDLLVIGPGICHGVLPQSVTRVFRMSFEDHRRW